MRPFEYVRAADAGVPLAALDAVVHVQGMDGPPSTSSCSDQASNRAARRAAAGWGKGRDPFRTPAGR
ncbi:hypothetical protein [Nonomuraea sp. NPDC049709]|uniref:hypothetical protein n=1 Tax=Nonomuraea sp. NPDC049709 TaxID=3154736 RepID=UPI00343EE567